MTIEQMEKEIRTLIREHAPQGTTFRWSNAKRQFGSCKYERGYRTARKYICHISISRPLAMRNSWEVVKRTVIHEIAHANTVGHHHDKVWKQECLRLGGDGKRCYDTVRQGGDVNPMPYKFTGKCPKCGKTFMRNRRTLNGYHCDRSVKIIWTENSTNAV